MNDINAKSNSYLSLRRSRDIFRNCALNSSSEPVKISPNCEGGVSICFIGLYLLVYDTSLCYFIT